MKDVRDALMLGHTSDGKVVRRPLSPHLQVYAPQMSSVLSILNRLTGIAISAGTLLLVWWLAAAASGPGAFATVQGFLHSWLGLLLLFGWTLALFYHLFGGLRHLAWDLGYGYELEQMRLSGWLALGATAVATVLVWAIGLWVGPR